MRKNNLPNHPEARSKERQGEVLLGGKALKKLSGRGKGERRRRRVGKGQQSPQSEYCGMDGGVF